MKLSRPAPPLSLGGFDALPQPIRCDQLGVLDCDRGPVGEHLDRVLVCGVKRSLPLLGQIEVRERNAAGANRRSKKAVHLRVSLGKADRGGVSADLVEPERPGVADQLAEDSAAAGQVRGGDATEAVVRGLSCVSRIILAAGIVMAAVFLGFVSDPDVIVKTFGLGLAAAIPIDVLIVRLLLAPAVMALLGDRAWQLPPRLDRLLPRISLDGAANEPATATTENAVKTPETTVPSGSASSKRG